MSAHRCVVLGALSKGVAPLVHTQGGGGAEAPVLRPVPQANGGWLLLVSSEVLKIQSHKNRLAVPILAHSHPLLKDGACGNRRAGGGRAMSCSCQSMWPQHAKSGRRKALSITSDPPRPLLPKILSLNSLNMSDLNVYPSRQ